MEDSNPSPIAEAIQMSFKLVSEHYVSSQYAISESRLPLLNETGAMEASLVKLRKRHHIPRLKPEEDFYEFTEDNDINLYNSSPWFHSLSQQEDFALLADVVEELRKFELPLTLIENYTAALVYRVPVLSTMLPTTFLGNLLLIAGNLDEIPLSTEDKEYALAEFRHAFGIRFRGRVPKLKKEVWDAFQKLVISCGVNKVRRLRSSANVAAVVKKGKVMEVVEQRLEQENDLSLVAEYMPQDPNDPMDRKALMRLRKQRERMRRRNIGK